MLTAECCAQSEREKTAKHAISSVLFEDLLSHFSAKWRYLAVILALRCGIFPQSYLAWYVLGNPEIAISSPSFPSTWRAAGPARAVVVLGETSRAAMAAPRARKDCSSAMAAHRSHSPV